MNESGMLTHLAVIESEPLLRAAWERLIRSFSSCWVAGSYSSFDDFYIRSNGYPYDVFLLRMEDSWTINWQELRHIRAHKPGAGIVVLLMRASIRYTQVALQSGANAVVCTAAEPNELHEAIVAAAGARQYLCRLAAGTVKALQEEDKSAHKLSSREADVLSLTARGLRLKEIAEQLGVNAKTAYSYRLRAMQKLGLQNTAQIIRYALENTGQYDAPPLSDAEDLSPAVHFDEED